MLISRAKQIAKVVGINITITGVLLISPALLNRLYETNQVSDSRAYYPTYSNKEFAIKVFNELNSLSMNYKSFLGWRRGQVNLKYTNISGPYNTRKSIGESLDKSVWFFGGSTMWGTGVADSQTIPSHFNSLTNKTVYNFGESGWNSRQSLNQLINAIGDNQKPTDVIFYDGVNDVFTQCRSYYHSLPTHDRELRVQEALQGRLFLNKLKNFIISPYIRFAAKFNTNRSSITAVASKNYDCDANQAKARSVAKHLVNNWRTAYSLSRSNNFKFYGILQPTLFSTETNSDYLTREEVNKHTELKRQYNAVYPLILEEISLLCELDKDACASMIDGTEWLDGKNNTFIDFCHVNSLGNNEIARKVALLIK